MRYYVLATDYDGTIAKNGSVDESTRQSIKKLRESGRKVILVTGREVDDLILAFGNVDPFDFVVAENVERSCMTLPQSRGNSSPSLLPRIS